MGDLTGHWRRFYDNKYLGAWDLWDSKTNRYREVRAKILRVTDDEVVGEGGRKSTPLQLHLAGSKGPIATPMILSRKNGTTLQTMLGRSPKGWEGKEITIYVRQNTQTGKGTGDVLTIRSTRATESMREAMIPRGPAIPEDDMTDPSPEDLIYGQAE